MARLALVGFTLLFYNILLAQSIAVVKDSIMQAYMESGYGTKHFVPRGGHEKNEIRVGFWKDYEVKQESSFFTEKDEPLEVFGNYLLYGEGEFKEGKRTGEWSIYVIEDKTFKKILSKKLRYLEGMPVGDFKCFYPNGTVARVGNYVHGKMQDSSIVYYMDGKIFARRFYKDDEKEGEQDYFFENGKYKYVVKYANGKKEGQAVTYYEDGKINESSTYKSDSLNGAYAYYYPDGQLWTERIYENGHLLNVTKLYDKRGVALDKGTLKDGNGTANFYTEDGKIYTIQTYANGVMIKEDAK